MTSIKKRWCQSFSGKVVTPLALKVEQVSFGDIAHALAQKVRFSGQLREPGYSVAQHCVVGAEQIAGPFALAFLLHEVSEVYLPDIPAPIKPMLTLMTGDLGAMTWSDLEAQHADVIFEALGLSSLRPLIDSPEVHKMDLQMLMTEKRDLMGPEPEPWGIDVEPLEYKIAGCWDYQAANDLFTNTFRRLLRVGARK